MLWEGRLEVSRWRTHCWDRLSVRSHELSTGDAGEAWNAGGWGWLETGVFWGTVSLESWFSAPWKEETIHGELRTDRRSRVGPALEQVQVNRETGARGKVGGQEKGIFRAERVTSCAHCCWRVDQG